MRPGGGGGAHLSFAPVLMLTPSNSSAVGNPTPCSSTSVPRPWSLASALPSKCLTLDATPLHHWPSTLIHSPSLKTPPPPPQSGRSSLPATEGSKPTMLSHLHSLHSHLQNSHPNTPTLSAFGYGMPTVLRTVGIHMDPWGRETVGPSKWPSFPTP